ncbi:hypothetical protein T492DRAFT_1151359 [Pavlovales sp. CCMP2436]|nr:hypothetical protein T492DRAFT_1151359 [Pavlovales sp. CCMP2436]
MSVGGPRAVNGIVIGVQDEGIGLSESELSALSEDLMFTQMQGNGGTGLGLPIVRQLLRKHDDSLVLSSEGYGKGTRFEMHIACKIDGIIDPGLENSRALSAEPPIVKQRFPDDYRAFHVEDDAFVRFTLPLQTFNLLGVAYEQVEDGTEALELVRAGQKFDCIIIDNQMPRMSGAETTHKLRVMGYTGLLFGIKGDPSGCEERYAFEASGLDACLDKCSAGMAECVKLMKLHAARLLVDVGRELTASRELRQSVFSAGRRSSSSSAGWFGRRSSQGSTAIRETSPMREAIQDFSARIARVSRSARLSSRVEPVEWSSLPQLARSKRYLAHSPATSSRQQTELRARNRQKRGASGEETVHLAFERFLEALIVDSARA